MLDPINPKSCIKIAGSFERIAELLARYLYANLESEKTPKITQNGKLFKVILLKIYSKTLGIGGLTRSKKC